MPGHYKNDVAAQVLQTIDSPSPQSLPARQQLEQAVGASPQALDIQRAFLEIMGLQNDPPNVNTANRQTRASSELVGRRAHEEAQREFGDAHGGDASMQFQAEDPIAQMGDAYFELPYRKAKAAGGFLGPELVMNPDGTGRYVPGDESQRGVVEDSVDPRHGEDELEHLWNNLNVEKRKELFALMNEAFMSRPVDIADEFVNDEITDFENRENFRDQ